MVWIFSGIAQTRLLCQIDIIYRFFMILLIYNGSPPLLFFGMSQIVQLRKHFHEYQLLNKHENEKCGNYHTHKFLSTTLRLVHYNKNGLVLQLHVHSVLPGKYHEKNNLSKLISQPEFQTSPRVEGMSEIHSKISLERFSPFPLSIDKNHSTANYFYPF